MSKVLTLNISNESWKKLVNIYSDLSCKSFNQVVEKIIENYSLEDKKTVLRVIKKSKSQEVQ